MVVKEEEKVMKKDQIRAWIEEVRKEINEIVVREYMKEEKEYYYNMPLMEEELRALRELEDIIDRREILDNYTSKELKSEKGIDIKKRYDI